MGLVRLSARLAAAAAFVALPLAALAQAYPAKPVKIVAPFAPGGLADVLARAVAERLTARTSSPGSSWPSARSGTAS